MVYCRHTRFLNHCVSPWVCVCKHAIIKFPLKTKKVEAESRRQATGEEQVGLQDEVRSSVINLRRIRLQMLFKATEPNELTQGKSVNTDKVPGLGLWIQHRSGGHQEEEPFFQNMETFPIPKGCLCFKRYPRT